MIHGDGALCGLGKGRPEIEEREQILGYFAIRLAQGYTVSAIARAGLDICAYEPGTDGKLEPTVVRHLRGPTLERRYRQLRKELDEAIAWCTSNPLLANASYIGVSAPRPTIAFGDKPKLKRGRPRKNHTR